MTSPVLSTSNAGIFGISPGTGTDRGYGVAVQADGKVLLTGYSWNGKEDDFTTIRFNTDGSLDENFAESGIARTSIFTVNDESNTDNGTSKSPVAGDDRAYRIIVDSDQKILVTGLGYDSNSNYYVSAVRYLSNGQIDTDFGDNGIFSFARATDDQFLWQITEASDKGYYLHGDITTTKDIYKLTNDGSLDASFGSDGKLDLSQNNVISSDFQIYEGVITDGSFTNTPTIEIAKYNLNGTLDPSFGDAGTLSLSLTLNNSETAISVTPLIANSQYLYLSLTNIDSSYVYYVARIDISSESLDTTYGINGFASTPYGISARKVEFDNDGGLILGHGGADFVTSRLDSTGAIDTSFGDNGISTIDLDNRKNFGWDIAFDPNSGKTYVGGNRYQADNNNDYAIARLDESGDLDSTFAKYTKYTEGDSSTPAEPDITVSDNDSTTLASASIAISESYTPGDSLLFTNDNSSMGNIAGT